MDDLSAHAEIARGAQRGRARLAAAISSKLAVAVAITLFDAGSPAALATVVGVLVEVCAAAAM